MSCPCGRGKSLAACCGPLIAGERAAQSAEQLMRSRYTAYVMKEIAYLAATHDPSTLHRFDAEGAARWARQVSFRSLEVLEAKKGDNDDTSFVEFVARYTLDGETLALHERSRFRRIDGRWFYTDGIKPAARRTATVGRNTPCPCGSGKKYKRCCGSG